MRDGLLFASVSSDTLRRGSSLEGFSQLKMHMGPSLARTLFVHVELMSWITWVSDMVFVDVVWNIIRQHQVPLS